MLEVGWLAVFVVVALVAVVVKIAALAALARWLFKKIPDEPDHSASIVFSRADSDSADDGHVT